MPLYFLYFDQSSFRIRFRTLCSMLASALAAPTSDDVVVSVQRKIFNDVFRMSSIQEKLVDEKFCSHSLYLFMEVAILCERVQSAIKDISLPEWKAASDYMQRFFDSFPCVQEKH